MLAIRLQRQGKKGYPVYRVVVQEAQLTPTSGRVVAYVGHFNPHTKENNLDVAAIEKYLANGAQPTPRVVKLLIENKVKLPKWVEKPVTNKEGKIRFADKLRKNQPKEEATKTPAEVEEATEEVDSPVEPANDGADLAETPEAAPAEEVVEA